MPIVTAVPIIALSQNDYHDVDRVVMAHVFRIHNEFGRLLDEASYKMELADRLTADGMLVEREVRIRAEHGLFSKDYFVDLLVDRRTIIEAKTVKQLTSAHHGQGLNYLLLAGTHHGSLINFRASEAKRIFLSTALTHDLRRRFEVTDSAWPKGPLFDKIKSLAIELVQDLGLGLDSALYRDAITLLTGVATQPVSIAGTQRALGQQDMNLLDSKTALIITTLPAQSAFRSHLQRFLIRTPLQSIAWINLSIHTLHFELLRLP